ncbi:MAG: hypothetical protein AAGF67_13390, partial [Verrucomicrobiota bacterium]
MKTFITSSALAILSAVVFAWVLVQTGEELPRRSPDSYPPMGGVPAEPVREALQPSLEVMEETAVEEVVTISPAEVEEASIEEVEIVEEAADEPEPLYFEAMGPPAPTLPFVLNINAAEEGVSLQGSIPTLELKKAILGSMSAVFEEEEIYNHLKYSPDTQSGLWISYLPDFLERYFRYTAGRQEVTVVDDALILNGAVATEESKKALLNWAEPLGSRGLEIRDQVDVDEAVKESIETIPEDLAKSSPARFSPFTGEMIEENAPVEKSVVEPASLVEVDVNEPAAETVSEEVGGGTETELVYLAPFDEQYEVHTVPDLRESAAAASEESSQSTSSDSENTVGSTSSAEADAPLVDDGKPLIFEFESPAGEILSEDRPKIEFAIARAQRPRSIVYITGYSDYRGDFEANQNLALK